MILDSFKLNGKVALVTGASAGLGAAIAVALAEAGADVAAHGNSRWFRAGGIFAALSETTPLVAKESMQRQGKLEQSSPTI